MSINPSHANAFEMWTSNEKLIAESKDAIDCNRWDKDRGGEALQKLSNLFQEAHKWIFQNGNHETMQQCSLPNLECGETTKERLVELLDTIYPDKESSRNRCDVCGLSSISMKTTSNNSKCRDEEGQTDAGFQVAPVHLGSFRSDIELENSVDTTPNAEKSFEVITEAPSINSLVLTSTHGDVKRTRAHVTLSTEKARRLLAYRRRLAFERRRIQGELIIHRQNETEKQVTRNAQIKLVDEKLMHSLHHKSMLVMEAETSTKSFHEDFDCYSLAACVDKWQSCHNENDNFTDGYAIVNLRRPNFWCSGIDCLRTIFSSYVSVAPLTLTFLTFVFALSSCIENHRHPVLDAKVFKAEDILIDKSHFFQDFPILNVAASRSIYDKLSAMTQVVSHPTAFDIGDNATKIDAFTQLAKFISDCAGLNSFLVALYICAWYTVLLVIKCLLFARIQ